MNTDKCILCGQDANVIYKNHPGYKKPETFDICNCKTCDTSYSIPRNDATEIYDLIYKNGSKVMWYDRYWLYAKKVKLSKDPMSYLAEVEDTYWAVKEALDQISKNKNDIKILEIGSGLGYLTYSLRKDGYNINGLDISKEAVARATDNFGEYYINADIYEYVNKHEGEYDIVIFTELIEHINDILKFMKCVINLVSDTGNVIFTTPNKTVYPSNAVWVTDLPPVHCWWLSEESVAYIAKEINMNLKFLDFTKYYTKNYRAIDMEGALNVPIIDPWFDKDGTLLNVSSLKIDENPGSLIKRLIIEKSLVGSFYKRIKRFALILINNGKKQKLCTNKGPVLCAILSKNS